MWHASQISESLKLYANDYGFYIWRCRIWFSKLVDNRSAYIDRIHGSYERGLNNNKVDVIRGYAKFVNKNTVEVNGEQYTADHIIYSYWWTTHYSKCGRAEYGITSNEVFALNNCQNVSQ